MDRLPTPVFLGFPYSTVGKESTCSEGDLDSIPGLERSPGEGKGYPLQYSGLENSIECMVHGVTKSWTWLSDFQNNYFARLYKDSPWCRAHESESHSSRVQLFATPWTIQSTEFSRQKYEVGSLSLFQGISPTQGSNPGLLSCRKIFLPAEPQGKPKNTGVGSLSLLQQIFPTEELNRGLLHCRWVL